MASEARKMAATGRAMTKEDGEIEIRQMFELEDFGASEAVEHHRRLAEQIGKK